MPTIKQTNQGVAFIATIYLMGNSVMRDTFFHAAALLNRTGKPRVPGIEAQVDQCSKQATAGVVEKSMRSLGAFAFQIEATKLSQASGAKDVVLAPSVDGHVRALNADGTLSCGGSDCFLSSSTTIWFKCVESFVSMHHLFQHGVPA